MILGQLRIGARPATYAALVRDSNTQGHKGNHYGQVDGFSFELLVFKHENKRFVSVSYRGHKRLVFVSYIDHLSNGVLCSKI